MERHQLTVCNDYIIYCDDNGRIYYKNIYPYKHNNTNIMKYISPASNSPHKIIDLNAKSEFKCPYLTKKTHIIDNITNMGYDSESDEPGNPLELSDMWLRDFLYNDNMSFGDDTSSDNNASSSNTCDDIYSGWTDDEDYDELVNMFFENDDDNNICTKNTFKKIKTQHKNFSMVFQSSTMMKIFYGITNDGIVYKYKKHESTKMEIDEKIKYIFFINDTTYFLSTVGKIYYEDKLNTIHKISTLIVDKIYDNNPGVDDVFVLANNNIFIFSHFDKTFATIDVCFNDSYFSIFDIKKIIHVNNRYIFLSGDRLYITRNTSEIEKDLTSKDQIIQYTGMKNIIDYAVTYCGKIFFLIYLCRYEDKIYLRKIHIKSTEGMTRYTKYIEKIHRRSLKSKMQKNNWCLDFFGDEIYDICDFCEKSSNVYLYTTLYNSLFVVIDFNIYGYFVNLDKDEKLIYNEIFYRQLMKMRSKKNNAYMYNHEGAKPDECNCYGSYTCYCGYHDYDEYSHTNYYFPYLPHNEDFEFGVNICYQQMCKHSIVNDSSIF